MNTGVLATRPTGIHQEFNAYVTNIIPRPSLKSPRCVSYTKMIYCPSCSSARAWSCWTRSLQSLGMGRDSDWNLGLGLGLWSQSVKSVDSRWLIEVCKGLVHKNSTKIHISTCISAIHVYWDLNINNLYTVIIKLEGTFSVMQHV